MEWEISMLMSRYFAPEFVHVARLDDLRALNSTAFTLP